MERLVTRIGNEPAVPTEFDMDFAFDLDKETFDKLQRIFNRLCDLTDILGDDYDLDRLKELVQADKEGRCVVLPCKIGSKLYRTSMRKMQVYEVSVSREYFHDSKNKTTLFAVQIFENGKKPTSYECFEEKDIGKTVFFTREEAEAALEKMKGGNE